MFEPMKAILLEVDDGTYARLEEVAPARSRKRSEFLRAAIRRALWDIEEARTREAYLRAPDVESEAFDAATWDATAAPTKTTKPTKKARTRAPRRKARSR